MRLGVRIARSVLPPVLPPVLRSVRSGCLRSSVGVLRVAAALCASLALYARMHMAY
jgi:hypothetical protein